jgi:hypothetical protein
VSTGVLNILFTVCYYLELYRLFLCTRIFNVLCYSLSAVCTSHCNVYGFFLTVSTAIFFNLSAVNQYLTLYRMLVLFHCIHFCLLQYLHCFSVPHTVTSVCSVSLCPMCFSTVCPMCISTSYYTICQFYVTVSAAAFYNPSKFCQYVTLYRLLFLSRLLHSCLLQSLHRLLVLHIVSSVSSGYFTLYLLFVLGTSHRIFCLFCVTMSNAIFSSMSTV